MNMKRSFALLLALVMLLAMAVPAAAASDGSVTLTDAQGVGYGTADVTDGVLGALPEASRTGWTFVGWYDGPVTEKFDDEEPDHVLTDGETTTFYQWVVTSTGKQVHTGDRLDDGVDTLYAMFKPTNITYKMYPCGWKNLFGALSCGRQYGVPFTGIVYGWTNTPWEGFVFDGWYTAVTGGEKVDENTPVTGFDVYAHWHKADDPSVNQSTASRDFDADKTLQSVTMKTAKANVHVGGTVQLTASPSPARAWIQSVSWSSGDSGIASVSGTGLTATVQGVREGETTVTVTVNGLTASATVKVGHDFSVYVYGWAGTCTQQGWKQWKCSIPGCDERSTEYFPVSHTFSGERVVLPTCTSQGYTVRTCTKCGLEEKQNITPAKGHDFETTVTEGCGGKVTTEKCRVCGYIKTTTDASAGKHTWDSKFTVDKPATCAEAGSQSRHCLKCGAVTDVQTIPQKSEHSFGAWKVIEKADWEHEGLQERVCQICHTTEREVIPKTSNIPGVSPEPSATPEPTEEPESSVTPEPSAAPEPTAPPEPSAVPVPPAASVPAAPASGNGWVCDSGDWYRFKAGEPVANDWLKDGGVWYFMAPDGKMMEGLSQIDLGRSDDGWYYFSEKHDGTYGHVMDGWQKIEGTWYYFNPKHNGTYGRMVSNDWLKDGGVWYFIAPDGKMMEGLSQIDLGRSDDGWYYFSEKHDGTYGHVMTGWQTVGGNTYYFNPKHDGTFGRAYAAGTYTINGKRYTFDESGRLIS